MQTVEEPRTRDDPFSIEVEDVTGQLRRRVAGIPPEATVGEVVESLREKLRLPDQDGEGHPMRYGARTAGGDVLNASDRVRDVLDPGELVTLTRSVTAG